MKYVLIGAASWLVLSVLVAAAFSRFLAHLNQWVDEQW
jgi:hypothetical protein